jgi:hypothetical protein
MAVRNGPQSRAFVPRLIFPLRDPEEGHSLFAHVSYFSIVASAEKALKPKVHVVPRLTRYFMKA